MNRAHQFLIALCVTLSACSEAPRSPAEVYLERLSNVLEVDPDDLIFSTPRFPDQRDLVPSQPDANISIREFLSMRQCLLHRVLATKNSLLGKMAEPSQALLVDLQILEFGPSCVAQLKKDNQAALAEKLDVALTAKQESIPLVLWQALLAEAEARAFWSASHSSETYPSLINEEVAPAIETLSRFSSRVLAGDYALQADDASSIERQLNVLQDGDGGQLLMEFLRLAQDLNRANKIIEERLVRPLCLSPAPTPKARNLKNVVTLFFIGEVQPHAVALTQRYRQLMPAFYALEKPLLPYATNAYREWAQARDRIFQQGLDAARLHVAQIQRLFSQCGLQAG